MDRFLIGLNPMRPGESGLWVFHLLNPKAMIECLSGHVTTDYPHKHFSFVNSRGTTEEWTLSAYHFFTTDFNEPEKQITRLLNRAWRWYRAHIEWRYNNIKLDEHIKNN